jgi:hypothetical protein
MKKGKARIPSPSHLMSKENIMKEEEEVKLNLEKMTLKTLDHEEIKSKETDTDEDKDEPNVVTGDFEDDDFEEEYK